jgi:hypothetical protein
MADTSSKPLNEWERAHYVTLSCDPKYRNRQFWITYRAEQFRMLRRNMQYWGEWPSTPTSQPRNEGHD